MMSAAEERDLRDRVIRHDEAIGRIDGQLDGIATGMRDGFAQSARQHHELGEAMHARISKLRDELTADIKGSLSEMRQSIAPALIRGAQYGDLLAELTPRVAALEGAEAERQEVARRWAWLRSKAVLIWSAVTAGGGALVAAWWPKIEAAARALFGGGHPPSPPPGLPH